MWVVTIHDLVFMSQCFQQKKLNTLDILTFLQVRTDKRQVLTDKKKIKMSAYK